jgi:hypothetical protein
MTVPRVVLLAGILFAATLVVVPPATSQHCQMGIRASAKNALTPIPTPPYVNNSRLGCVNDYHELQPTDDQIFVRCHCPFNTATPYVMIEMDGLGWVRNLFPLYRTVRPTGVSYEFEEWITMPHGMEESGTLTITLQHPGYAAIVRYEKTPLPSG